MQKIKAFIFDMDGILLDTESVCRLCWQRAADELGLSGGDEIYRKCVGCNNNDMNVMIQDYFSTQRTDFNLDDEGVLCIRGRLCVPDMNNLREEIL